MRVCVCVCVCVCGDVCVGMDKMKTPDHSDLKLGTAVVRDTASMPIEFGFTRSRERVTGSIFRTFGISCHLVNTKLKK